LAGEALLALRETELDRRAGEVDRSVKARWRACSSAMVRSMAPFSRCEVRQGQHASST
jgi:hypothetical protein